MVMELPELEVWRREIERELASRKLAEVDVQKADWLKAFNGKDLTAELAGAKVTEVTRRGRWLLVRLANGQTIAVKPADGTEIRKMVAVKAARSKSAPPPAPLPEPELTLKFGSGAPLGIRANGGTPELQVYATENEAETIPEFATLGMDVVAEPVSWVKFGEELIQRSGKLRSVLTDQTFVVGLGPCYSDEILFASGLRYDRTPQSLSPQEIRRLYRSVVEVMHDAVKYGGTSLANEPFAGLGGDQGGYAQYLAVYRRDGLSSPRSRGKVVKTRLGQGYTYYCETTQM